MKNWTRFLIWWAVWSSLVLLLFVGIWISCGMPRGPDGLILNALTALVISILAPPVVWIIGKVTIG